jgi:hypothetical protein
VVFAKAGVTVSIAAAAANAAIERIRIIKCLGSFLV